MKAEHPTTRAAERARDRAARVKALAEDALLTKHESAAFVCMGSEAFVRYARRWPTLVAGARIVRATPGSRGRVRWLKSALIQHIREELLRPDLELDEVHADGDTVSSDSDRPAGRRRP